MIVDLGCYDPPGGYNSLRSLVERFRPVVIYGFDVQAEDHDGEIDGVPLFVRRAAAWVADEPVWYTPDGTSSRLSSGGVEVPGFDFSLWLREYGPAIVKMDIEGAEYQVLEKMRADGTDLLVDLLVIEWHGDPITDLRCPVMTWWN